MIDALLEDGGVRLAILVATVGTGAWLAYQKSSYLIDYFMVVVCFNRFIRRLLDWSEGEYDPQPLTSLAAPLIGCLMAAVVIANFRAIPRQLRTSGALIAVALMYAMVVGLPNQMAALYGLLSYVMPFAALFYPLAIGADEKVVTRWIRTMTTLGVVVALYGFYQWAVVPPWDAAWIEWSGMWSSMGHPIPYKMGICSTLESRGPFSHFMATAAIPMVASSRWRKSWGIVGAVFLVLGAILSQARSSWGFLILGVMCFAALRGGRGMVRVAMAAALLVGVLLAVLPRLPETERLTQRMESLTNLSEDSSFRGRVAIAQTGIGMMLTTPQGYGLGGTGMGAERIGEGAVIGDNGYLALLADFGIPGFTLLVLGLGTLVREVYRSNEFYSTELAALTLAMFASGIVFLMIGNWVSGPYSGMIMMLLGGTLSSARFLPAELPAQPSAPEHAKLAVKRHFHSTHG